MRPCDSSSTPTHYPRSDQQPLDPPGTITYHSFRVSHSSFSTFRSSSPMTLLEHLIARYPTAKRQTLRRMVQDGRVTINNQPARILKIQVADTDRIIVDERPARPTYSLAPLYLIHEDADILVISKPPGLLTSTVPHERRPTALAIVRRYLVERNPRDRAGLIHRLDRDASGLLVFSKNNFAFESLKKQFFEHSVRRVYTAVVHGRPNPPAGRIESRLIELPDGSVRNTRQPRKGELAITEYRTLKTVGSLSLLRVTLHTGRKHQIRFHLASHNHPIVGDPIYNKTRPDKPPLLLCATTLILLHPRTGERLTFEIPPPPEIQNALAEPDS